MIQISDKIFIPNSEIEIHAIRSQGSGGQNVNKVSSAIHLVFNITTSSLPDEVKNKLFMLLANRISKDGELIIKAQRFRSQEKNKEDALSRLQDLIKQTLIPKKYRKATKPTMGSKTRRLDSKSKKGNQKVLRGKIEQ